MQSPRFKAFISYSHADADAVGRLHRALESYRIPSSVVERHGLMSKRLGKFFRDREDLSAGSSLTQALESALDASEFLIVACSPNSAKSAYIEQEILYFQRSNRAHRILSVIVADEPAQEIFPAPLRYELGPTFELLPEQKIEPLAADLRADGDGLHGAKLKLVAGMLGVAYDDLAQREQVRRQRRLSLIAGAATTGMLLMSGLAFYAQTQRTAAEYEARKANRVVDFLIDTFRVADPGAENPREITAVQILERGRAKLDGQLHDDPGVRAALLTAMGSVFFNLGLVDETESAVTAALLSESLAEAKPEDATDRLLLLARASLRRQDTVQATSYTEQAAALVAEQPDPEKAAAVERLRGWTKHFAFAGEAALPHYVESLRLLREVHSDGSRQVGQALQAVANVLLDIGRFEDAEPYMVQSVEIFEELYGSRHTLTAGQIHNYARLLNELERYAEALPKAEQSLAVLQEILGSEHMFLAPAFITKGRALAGVGQVAEAASAFTAAVKVGETAFGENHGFNRYARVFQAHNLARLGRNEEATSVFARATAVLEALRSEEHQEHGIHLIDEAELYVLLGQPKLATARCEAGLEILARQDVGPDTEAAEALRCQNVLQFD